MKKWFGGLLTVFLVLLIGCNQETQMKPEGMAQSEAVQKAFSNGRLDVMKAHEEAKRVILQNSVKEQEMTIADNTLRPRLLHFNMTLNEWMTKDPRGREQLANASLAGMNTIYKNQEKLNRLIGIQTNTRQRALKDARLQKEILQQNLREQAAALKNPHTAEAVKKGTLKINEAVLDDPNTKDELLAFNVRLTRDIAAEPALRSEMAKAMLPLLKDQQIARELEQMIKMATAEEAQKMQVKMKQLMKQEQLTNQKQLMNQKRLLKQQTQKQQTQIQKSPIQKPE